MKDTLPTSEPQAALEKRTAFLVVALQADDLPAGASSHVLRDVTSVAIGRGDQREVSRSAPSGAHALTLLLPDSRLSRQHARLEPEGERWLLRDEGSKNGSFVNGERVDQRMLEPGDLIELGGTFLLYTEQRRARAQHRDEHHQQRVRLGSAQLQRRPRRRSLDDESLSPSDRVVGLGSYFDPGPTRVSHLRRLPPEQ